MYKTYNEREDIKMLYPTSKFNKIMTGVFDVTNGALGDQGIMVNRRLHRGWWPPSLLCELPMNYMMGKE